MTARSSLPTTHRLPLSLRAGLVLSALIAIAGCDRTPEPPRSYVCAKFSMSVAHSDWSALRATMIEVSNGSAWSHRLDIGSSEPNLLGYRTLRYALEYGDGQHKLVLGALFATVREQVWVYAFENDVPRHAVPCATWSKTDYELAKSLFSAKWAIISETTQPYLIGGERKPKSWSCILWHRC